MKQSEFRERLVEELSKRRAKNSRYSLRAFALLIGADHSTLSQVLNGRRQVPISQIMTWCKRLHIDEEEATAYVIAEVAPDSTALAHAEHLRHWSAEALSILRDQAHWETVKLCRSEKLRLDTRLISRRVGATVDQVNIILARLLRLGLIDTHRDGKWRATKECAAGTQEMFLKTALRRVREKAAISA